MKNLLKVILAVAASIGIATACSSGAGTNVADNSDDTVDVFDHRGVMVRHNIDRPTIYLLFSADSMFEGAPTALKALDERGLKGNFFFTGNFLERPENAEIIRRVIAGGHYVGGHSNRHLLLADWEKCEPIVPNDSLIADVDSNFNALKAFGVERDSCRWFMPPFEWIATAQVPALQDSLGLKVINPTPGIQIFRDYTTPDMPEYHSSQQIIDQLFAFEKERGLNGAFLIIHLGTQDLRTDKLYDQMPMILDSLATMGYTFERLH